MDNDDICCRVTVTNRDDYNRMIAALEADMRFWREVPDNPEFPYKGRGNQVDIDRDALSQITYDMCVGNSPISFNIYTNGGVGLTYTASGELEVSLIDFIDGVQHKEHYLDNLSYIAHKFGKKPTQSSESLDPKLYFDTVVHPEHYNFGSIETIKYIEDKLTPTEFRGYIKGNVLKYLSREAHKNGTEDLKKAHWYLSYLLEKLDDSDSDDA